MTELLRTVIILIKFIALKMMAWSLHTCSAASQKQATFCIVYISALCCSEWVGPLMWILQLNNTEVLNSSSLRFLWILVGGRGSYMVNNFKAISLAIIGNTSIVKDQILCFSRKQRCVRETRWFDIQGLLFLLEIIQHLEYFILE